MHMTGYRTNHHVGVVNAATVARDNNLYSRVCSAARDFAIFGECGTRSYEGKSGDCNSTSVEFALFGGWVHIMDMIPNQITVFVTTELGSKCTQLALNFNHVTIMRYMYTHKAMSLVSFPDPITHRN